MEKSFIIKQKHELINLKNNKLELQMLLDVLEKNLKNVTRTDKKIIIHNAMIMHYFLSVFAYFSHNYTILSYDIYMYICFFMYNIHNILRYILLYVHEEYVHI